jgi:hypothetical protein
MNPILRSVIAVGDLTLAYIPMAYLGGRLAIKLTSKTRLT